MFQLMKLWQGWWLWNDKNSTIYKFEGERKMKQLIIITLFTSIIFADTIVVDQTGNGDYYTITDAYNASASQDTILIRSGVYPEGILDVNHIVHFIGVNNYSVTWTYGDNYMVQFSSNSSGSSVSNITFAGSYVYTEHANLDANNCIFDDSYIKMYQCTVNVTNSLFLDNLALYYNSSSYTQYGNLTNCIFYNSHSNQFDQIDYLDIQNCIFINCPDNTPDSNESLSIVYSCFYNSEFVDGYGNINSNPNIENIANGDYRLQDNSPCIDAGNPAGNHNDLDGSRNDMGVYGGPNSWGGLGPVITNIQVAPEEVQQGETITIQATGTVE